MFRFSISVLALIATSVLHVHAADACSPPERLYLVEATAPIAGAEGTPLSMPIVVQLAVEERYDFGFSAYDSGPFSLTVSDPAGALVASSGDILVESTFEPGERAVVSTSVADLVSGEQYTAKLERNGHTYEWQFVAGTGDVIVPAPELVARARAYYGQEAVYGCCPMQFVGECPNCSVIGHEPVAAIEATITPIEHAIGPAAYSYALQLGSDEGGWTDVVVAATEVVPLRLRYEDTRLDNARSCVRVVARSVIEDLELTSDTFCFEPEDFGAEPDFGPYSALQCGDVVEPEEPEDPQEQDPEVEDPEGDDPSVVPDGDDSNRQEPEGWEFSEAQSSDASDGCGCAAARGAHVPASALLLGLFFGLRRRRREVTGAT